MNTLENKAKFFDQYSGQEIITHAKANYTITPFKWYQNVDNYGVEMKSYYALLKPLSSISYDEAIEVSKINGGDLQSSHGIEGMSQDGYGIISDIVNDFLPTSSIALMNTIDYLRSKGYALPWNGISVEQQIEWGWIKLIEE